MAALCSVEEPSSVEAVEHQLDVIHSLRNDVEIFTQKMKTKLSAMEDALQKQVDDLSHTEAVANEMCPQMAETCFGVDPGPPSGVSERPCLVS